MLPLGRERNRVRPAVVSSSSWYGNGERIGDELLRRWPTLLDATSKREFRELRDGLRL